MLMGLITEAFGLPVYYFTVSMPILSILTVVRIAARLVADVRSGNY